MLTALSQPILATLSWPILERIPLWGEAALSPHGVGIAVGFVLAAGLFARVGDRRGLRADAEPVDAREVAQEILVRAALGAIVVARLAYVLTHLDEFTGSARDVLSILEVTDGGLSFLGGVVGALLVCVPWIRSQDLSTPRVLDAGAPAVALGLLCGRLGDLVIGDHIGAPSGDFLLGWRCSANLWDRATNSFGRVAPRAYPDDRMPVQGCYDAALHQTALYDGLAAVVVLVGLLVLARRALRPGVLAASLVLLYAPLRILGDVLREDRRWFGLTGSQWFLLAAAAGVTVWLLRDRATSEQDGGRPVEGTEASDDEQRDTSVSQPTVRGDE